MATGLGLIRALLYGISSINYQIDDQYLRICVGSDSPEFSPQRLRRRFEHFAHGLSEEKAENVAHKNLFAFAGLTP